MTVLLIVLAIAITFLVTDFRRHLEIKDIEASHEAEIDLAFDRGYKFGRADGLLEMRRLNKTPNIINY